jgi:hypothetical protein
VTSVISGILPLPSVHTFISPFLIPQHVTSFPQSFFVLYTPFSFHFISVLDLHHTCSNIETDKVLRYTSNVVNEKSLCVVQVIWITFYLLTHTKIYSKIWEICINTRTVLV